MTIHPLLIRIPGLLGACLFAAAAMGAPPPPATVDATGIACGEAKYKGLVAQIQRDLNVIHANDRTFKKDAVRLHDGIFGPVTRSWLVKFCQQHPFKVRERSFDADVAAELARYRASLAVTSAAPAKAEPAPPLAATYRYDPEVLRTPKNVEKIVSRLRALTDHYAEKTLFDGAVRRALRGLDPDPTTLDRIGEFSRIDGYLLPGDKLASLTGASLGLREKLMLKTDIDYANADEFHLDLAAAVGEGPEKAELARYIGRIDRLAQTTHYRIPDTIAADLAGAGELDPPLAVLYDKIKYIEYPSKQLLEDALRARLEWGLGMCKANRHRQEGRLADGDIAPLWALVDAGPEQFGRVKTLRDWQGRCSVAQMKEVQTLIDAAHRALYDRLEKVADLSKPVVKPSLKGQAGPRAIPGCGCAHDARDGMTYGFYPLWTDATAEDTREVDFDVLSRVGLYGLTIDDKGSLNFPAGVSTPPWTLLEAAHRHMTKVDWVLYKNDWPAAGEGNMADFLGKLRQGIDRLFSKRYPETDWRGTALATFGREQGPTIGDGIVLRFDGFPGDREARDALHAFVGTLANDLRAMKPSRQLFIMVTEDEVLGAPDGAEDEARPFSAANLHALIEQSNSISAVQDSADSRHLRDNDLRVLVLMKEPTSRQKLLLRAGIENALFSTERVRVLRNVIPVVEYDGVREGQLNDDIVYFRDNFGGIGFWPMPFANPKDEVEGATTANKLLHAYFHNAGLDGGFLSEAIDLICPNRSWLRWLAWASLILAAVAIVTLARCRGCGTRLDSNGFYMAGMVALIVLPFLVIATLIVGDPLTQQGFGVPWFVGVLLSLGVLVFGAYVLLKPARKLP